MLTLRAGRAEAALTQAPGAAILDMRRAQHVQKDAPAEEERD